MPEPSSSQPWNLFVQPDQRSCGATALVVARILGDPKYALYVDGGDLEHARTVAGDQQLRERFRVEALAMHRRITGLADVSGKPQVPWPRTFGTPPWAVARQLSGTRAADGSVVTYDWHVARTSLNGAFDRLLAAGAHERVAAIFVGNTWLPRHVALAVDSTPTGSLHVFDPARGRLCKVDRSAFVERRLGIAGWDVPWFVVTPSS